MLPAQPQKYHASARVPNGKRAGAPFVPSKYYLEAVGSAGYSRETTVMLQPHSFLWHYLWAGSDVLLLALAVLTWRRGLGPIVDCAAPSYAHILAHAQILDQAIYLVPKRSQTRVPARQFVD